MQKSPRTREFGGFYSHYFAGDFALRRYRNSTRRYSATPECEFSSQFPLFPLSNAPRQLPCVLPALMFRRPLRYGQIMDQSSQRRSAKDQRKKDARHNKSHLMRFFGERWGGAVAPSPLAPRRIAQLAAGRIEAGRTHRPPSATPSPRASCSREHLVHARLHGRVACPKVPLALLTIAELARDHPSRQVTHVPGDPSAGRSAIRGAASAHRPADPRLERHPAADLNVCLLYTSDAADE